MNKTPAPIRLLGTECSINLPVLPDVPRAQHGALSNFFEGHQPQTNFWTAMPSVTYSADTEQELTRDREEMLSVARQICQLFGLGNRVLRTYANYTIGSNLDVAWHTKDNEWNDRAEELFAAKAKMLDLRGMEDFTGMARLAVIHTIREGDVGFIKIANPGYPMIDPIEADRIGPFVLYGGNTKLFGGVEYDPCTQRPLRYHIADRTRYSQFVNPRAVDAQSFIHVFDTLRFDGHRGMSAFAYGALGRARSIRQLVKSEEIGVQVANKWAAFIKTVTGNAMMDNPNGLDLSDDTVASEGGTGSGGTIKAPPTEPIFDGMIQRLLKDEDIVFPNSNRPSPAWQGFLEFLIRDFSIALDLPYEFVWNMAGMTGPAVRLTSKQAERTFDAMWAIVHRRFMVPLISWVISDAIATGQIPPNAEFWKFQVQRPSHPSIDAGRDSTANVSEYGARLRSGADIAAESGTNIFRIQRQLGREYQHAQAVAKEFDCPVDFILSPPKPNGTAAAPPAEPEGDEPLPAKTKKPNEKIPVKA